MAVRVLVGAAGLYLAWCSLSGECVDSNLIPLNPMGVPIPLSIVTPSLSLTPITSTTPVISINPSTSIGAVTGDTYDQYIGTMDRNQSMITGAGTYIDNWVNSRGTYKKEAEREWYAANTDKDFKNDIHYKTGYYGQAADNAVRDFYGIQY